MLGRPIHTLLDDEGPRRRPAGRRKAEAAGQPGRKRRRESQLITRFGRCRSVDVIREPFNGLDGHTYVLLLISDISERRRARAGAA